MSEHEQQPEENTAETAAQRQSTLEERNGVKRPSAHSLTGSVWDKADKLSQHHGRPATRKEVLDALPDMSKGTVATQYGKWRTFYGLTKAMMGEGDAEAKAAAKEAAAALKAEQKAVKAAEREAAKAAKKAAAKAEKEAPKQESDTTVE